MACGKNGATCWLAGAVRNLQKRVELLETRDAAPALVVEHISQAPAGYTAHAPVMENIPPEPSVCAVPAPDAEYFSTAPAVIYAAPAPTVFAVPASVGECFSPAPEVSYAAPAPLEEYISSVSAVHTAPASIMEYIAPATARYAGPAPDEEKYFISMTRLEEVNYEAQMIHRGWRWTRKRIVLRAASEERLQEKLREVRRRLVACLRVGASAKKKTESLKEVQSTFEGC